jgi:hypothetical protein
VAGDPGADLPADPAVDADVDEDVAGRLVLDERHGELGRQLDAVHGYEVRRPDVLVVVALVADGQPRGHGDDHVLLLRVHVHLVVVDADPVVDVPGGDGGLHSGEEVGGRRRRDVEAEHGQVLQVELGLVRPEHQPDDEDHEGDQEEGGHQRRAAPAVQTLPLAMAGIVPAAAVLVPAAAVQEGEEGHQRSAALAERTPTLALAALVPATVLHGHLFSFFLSASQLDV